MQLKTIHNFKKSVFVIACLTMIFVICGFSQNPDQERPKVTDFGRSLENKKENKQEKDKPQSDKTEIESQNEDEVIKVETSLVRTDVLVVDRRGQAVLGLKSDDFIVTENDVPQEIGTFSLGDSTEIPRSIVLIIDYSGSQLPYIQTSVNAAKVLVDKLNPKDKMAIVTDDVELLTDFTHDKSLLKNKLDSLAARAENGSVGKSRQYNALMATLNELFADEDVRPIIIFQTDGDEVFAIANKAQNYKGMTTFTVEDLFAKIEKSRVTIYSVVSGFSLLGLTPEDRIKKVTMNQDDIKVLKYIPNKAVPEYLKKYSDRLYAQQKAMEIVARTSGGFTELLETPEQADQVYSRILNEINYRYLIGYYPTSQGHDNKRRNVKIEVRGHPEYIVWGRKFYFAPQDNKTENK